MKREGIIAVIIGIGLGAIVGVVFLVFFSQQDQVAQSETISNVPEGETQVREVQNRDFQFSISEPSNFSVARVDTISVTGKASRNSLLVIQSAGTDIVREINSEQFTVDINLALGENNIHFTLYPKDFPNDYREETLLIYYIPFQ